MILRDYYVSIHFSQYRCANFFFFVVITQHKKTCTSHLACLTSREAMKIWFSERLEVLVSIDTGLQPV